MNVLITEKEKKASSEIGGKAKNLLKLEDAGFNVPRWVVIPESTPLKQLTQDKVNEEAIQEINNLVVPDEILPKVANYFGDEFNKKTFAVRSSASDEDGLNHSFAGQFETFLHVPASDIVEKVKLIWQSVISERVLAYRSENNLGPNLSISVIVQEMIEADVSGVAFGKNPVNGDEKTKVVSSVFGLGEGLVSGELDGDTYTIQPDGINTELAIKSHAIRRKGASGIQKVKVNGSLQNEPSLNSDKLLEIANTLDRLNTLLGSAQDIEFSYVQDQLYLLQTRPITTGSTLGEYILWDNSNIIESYPGITTPLTYSFIIKMYEMVYRQFVGILGVRETEIEGQKEVFENTLGLVRGRVYYNLLSWYKMLAMVPGYSINAEFMENMMGVKEKFDLEANQGMGKGKAWYRTMLMLFNMIKLQIKLPKERTRFMSQLNVIMKKYKALHFESMDSKEVIKYYKTFEESLLLKWKAPLINDFFAMIWFGMLQKKIEKLFPNNGNLHNDLLCGSQDIISVEPIRKTIDLAKLISNDADAKSLFENQDSAVIWQELENGSFREIKQSIDSYLNSFGERCVGELKLETISYTQKPELFIGVLKSYVTQKVGFNRPESNLEDELRTAAENKISDKLKGKPIKKWWLNYIVKKARDLVSNRENLRYERTRGFGMVRTMFTALGNTWHSEGHLKDTRDIFYLELSEIKNASSGKFQDDWKQKIERRKKEFNAFRKQEIPQERFFTYGYNFTDEYIYSLEKVEEVEQDLKGIGCCPGIVKGKVQVVLDPTEVNSVNGEILVTSSTDPGWVTLFPTCSAIIVERGSLLSHSAIVSRELGIPCIVSVSGLLRTLKTGDEITMDGSTGRIKIESA